MDLRAWRRGGPPRARYADRARGDRAGRRWWGGQGYDVEELLRRRQPGRPTMGSAVATVESVRLGRSSSVTLLLRVAAEQTSVSEVICAAVRHYLQAG